MKTEQLEELMYAQDASDPIKWTVPFNLRKDWEDSQVSCEFFFLIKGLAFKQRKTAYNKQNPQEYEPRFWRKEKGTNCYGAKNQKHEPNILGLFIYIKTLLFSKIVVHFLHPIYSMKKNRKVCGIVVY